MFTMVGYANGGWLTEASGHCILVQAVKASRAEAQAADAAMLAHATAASLADSPADGGIAAAGSGPDCAADTSPPPAAGAMDLTAADDVQAAATGKLPPPEWFEIEEDEYPAPQRAGSGSHQKVS